MSDYINDISDISKLAKVNGCPIPRFPKHLIPFAQFNIYLILSRIRLFLLMSSHSKRLKIIRKTVYVLND